MTRILDFFVDNFPSGKQLLVGAPLSLLWAAVCLWVAGHLKTVRGWKTGYTRKVFHFLTFFSVAVAQWQWGTPLVCLFGGMTSLVILYALLRGSGHAMYEAMAREKDEPKRTHFIVVPFFATLLGGVFSNVWFGPVAVVGYLVTGLGDAVGEPVGTRYGKHPYRVPSFGPVAAIRSWEGSAAVTFMSTVAILLGVWMSPELHLSAWSLLVIPAVGVASGAAEAVSPHGWDNATMQIVPSLLITLLM